MADTSLDDFFAKKDKSKKKSKKSQLGIGDDVSQTKSEKKSKKKQDKISNSQSGSANTTNSAQGEEEEWHDFEEEKEVDYTGLRIQNMQIAKEVQEREEREQEEIERLDEDNEGRERRDAASGPWNKVNEPPPPPVVEKPPPEPVKEEPAAPKPTGKYVPPSMRNQSAISSSPLQPMSRGKKKHAPNVNSEEDFPTLGGGPVPAGRWYNSTNSSDLVENAGQRRGANLQLENKFSALQD